MRIFKKIMTIVFIIVSVLSLSLSIVLFISSSTSMTFFNNADARQKTYFAANSKIESMNEFSLLIKKPNSIADDSGTIQENVSCVAKENNPSQYNCKIITKAYDSTGNHLKSTYYPGDGFKYMEDVITKTKTKESYDNSQLEIYVTTLLNDAKKGIKILSYNDSKIEECSAVYKTDISFDFSTFSLTKAIEISYLNGSNVEKVSLSFDKKDYVTSIHYLAKKETVDISYNKTELSFPNFSVYTEV